MSTQAYFEDTDGDGDWYLALTAVSAGQSPLTHPAKWRRVEIPSYFERYMVAEASATLLAGDGQSDKAILLRREGAGLLEELVGRHTDRGDFARPIVSTR